MYNTKLKILVIVATSFYLGSCKLPAITASDSRLKIPEQYTNNGTDTSSAATIKWKEYFTDPFLQELIDTALASNRELMTTLQEIEIARSEVLYRKGRILPVGGVRAGVGVDKPGRYTSQGAGDASTDIEPGKKMPDPLGDFNINAYASWEVDIWKKLRNAQQAAIRRFVATQQGRNFVVTNLVAEIANNYYELLALDKQLETVEQNIGLQKAALEIVKVQKEATKATELAVQKFQAEVFKTESIRYDIRQNITEAENRINGLLSRFPQPVKRSSTDITSIVPAMVSAGIPSQLLRNRPDIKIAELQLEAARLDVKVARAEFLPSFEISSIIGLQSFKASYLVKLPASIAYSLVGDLVAPLINRSAIKAEFNAANARQLQALYDYEKSILNACLEVSNSLANISNLNNGYNLKEKQVDALNKSVALSDDLFRYAKADYLEVLMTQRDVLEAKMELIETQKNRMNAVVNIYRNLGGGW